MILKSKLVSLLLTISALSFGQKKYYKDHEGKIMDSLAYLSIKAEKMESMKAISKKVVINDSFKESYRNTDSVVYTYRWDIRVGEAAELSKGFNRGNHIGKELFFPKLSTLTGEQINSDNFKGKPTLINFWFTSCAPCIDELPILNRLIDKYKDSVNFIAVTFESKEKVNKFLKKNKYHFTQVADAKKYIRNDLKMNSFPVNIFLDKQGVVRFIENGIPYKMNDKKELVIGTGREFEDKIKELLKM